MAGSDQSPAIAEPPVSVSSQESSTGVVYTREVEITAEHRTEEMDSGVPTTPPLEGDGEFKCQPVTRSATLRKLTLSNAPSNDARNQEDSPPREQGRSKGRRDQPENSGEIQAVTPGRKQEKEVAERKEQNKDTSKDGQAGKCRSARTQDEGGIAAGGHGTATREEADEKVVVLEYERTADPRTTATGNLVVDSVNRFLDNWLAPGDDTGPVRIETRPKEFRIFDQVSVPVVRCRGEEQRLGCLQQMKSMRFQCPHLDFSGREERCPVCQQHMPGTRGPPPPPTWTRWLFKQCEEPVDLQPEFLVYPNPLVYVGYSRPNIDQPWFGTTGYVPS